MDNLFFTALCLVLLYYFFFYLPHQKTNASQPLSKATQTEPSEQTELENQIDNLISQIRDLQQIC